MVGRANSDAVTALFSQKLTGGAAPPKLQSGGSKAQTKFGATTDAGSAARPIGAFSVRTVTVVPDEDCGATWVEEATTLVPETHVEHPATELPDADDMDDEFIWRFLTEDDEVEGGAQLSPQQPDTNDEAEGGTEILEAGEPEPEYNSEPLAKRSREK